MPTTNFIFAIVKSFGLHIFVGVALIASVSFKAAEKPKPQVIQVEPISSIAVDKNKLAQQVKQIQNEKNRQQRVEEKRVADLEARANKARRNAKSEQQRLVDLNKQTKKSQATKRKADAAAKKAREKEKRDIAKAKKAEELAKKKLQEKDIADKALADTRAKRKKEEADAKKARDTRLRKEKLAKEAKARKEKAERERAEQERALQQQMAEEQAQRNVAKKQQVMGEVAKYKALIQQRVQQNLIVDETMKGKFCRLNIKLAFNGLATSVKILEGDRNLCSAAQNAILKTGKLPISKDPAVFEELKNINLTVRPEL